MPSRIKGRGKFRRLLRRMPDAVQSDLGTEMRFIGKLMLGVMRSKSPRRTGQFAGGLEMRFTLKTLKLRIGFFKKRRALDPWYARIVEVGRKAQTVNVTRRKNTKPYLMKVKGREPAKIVTGRYPELRKRLDQRLKLTFTRALDRIAGGD